MTAFFGELEADNTRRFFAANRHRYEREVRTPLLGLLDALDPVGASAWRVYRPNRDTRFQPRSRPLQDLRRRPGGRRRRQRPLPDARSPRPAGRKRLPMFARDQLARNRAWKGVEVPVRITDVTDLDPDDAMARVRDAWERGADLCTWLASNVGPTELVPEEVYGRSRR